MDEGQPRIRLPHEQRGRCGDLIRQADLGHAHRPSEKIGGTHEADHRGQACGADGDTDNTVSPRVAETVVDHHPDVDAEHLPHPRLQCFAGGVRVAREQQRTLARFGMLDVRLIDSRVGHDEAEALLDDQKARPVAHDFAGLGEDDLDQASVLSDDRRQVERRTRRVDVPQIDIAAFRLGHDLLSDHENVVITGNDPAGTDAVHHNCTQVVSGLHQRNTRDRGQRKCSGRMHKGPICPRSR